MMMMMMIDHQASLFRIDLALEEATQER